MAAGLTSSATTAHELLSDRLREIGFQPADANKHWWYYTYHVAEGIEGRLEIEPLPRGKHAFLIDAYDSLRSTVLQRHLEERLDVDGNDLELDCIPQTRMCLSVHLDDDEDDWYVICTEKSELDCSNLDSLIEYVKEQVIKRWETLNSLDAQIDFITSIPGMSNREQPGGSRFLVPLCFLIRGDIETTRRQCEAFWKPVRRRPTAPFHEPYKAFMATVERLIEMQSKHE